MLFCRSANPRSFCKGTQYYRLLKQAGYEAIDYSSLYRSAEPLLLEESARDRWFAGQREEIESSGLAVTQIHGPASTVSWAENEETKEQRRLLIRRSLKAAVIMGSPIVVVHPFLYSWAEADPEPEKRMTFNKEFFASLTEEANRLGVKVALENMPGKNGAVWNAEQMNEIADFIHDDAFGFCLDTGHAGTNGFRPADMVYALGKRLLCLHIHACGWDDNDRHLLPLGSKMDFSGFFDALQKVGYSGTFNSEANFEEFFDEEGFEPAVKAHFAALKQIARL